MTSESLVALHSSLTTFARVNAGVRDFPGRRCIAISLVQGAHFVSSVSVMCSGPSSPRSDAASGEREKIAPPLEQAQEMARLETRLAEARAKIERAAKTLAELEDLGEFRARDGCHPADA